MMMKSNIYFIGFMGTGKSTISRQMAAITGYQEIDTDYEIAKKENMSIPEIFEKHGETYFRELETKFLQKMQKRRHCIVSCGGGMVLRQKNVELMKKNGVIVLLTATPETVLERVKNGKERPILNGHMNVAYIKKLMEERRACYEAAGEIVIATDGRQTAEMAEELKKNLESSKFSFDF